MLLARQVAKNLILHHCINFSLFYESKSFINMCIENITNKNKFKTAAFKSWKTAVINKVEQKNFKNKVKDIVHEIRPKFCDLTIKKGTKPHSIFCSPLSLLFIITNVKTSEMVAFGQKSAIFRKCLTPLTLSIPM